MSNLEDVREGKGEIEGKEKGGRMRSVREEQEIGRRRRRKRRWEGEVFEKGREREDGNHEMRMEGSNRARL